MFLFVVFLSMVIDMYSLRRKEYKIRGSLSHVFGFYQIGLVNRVPWHGKVRYV